MSSDSVVLEKSNVKSLSNGQYVVFSYLKNNEEIKEKYGIGLIGKEMWVWNSENKKDAELAFVISKDNASPFYNYIGYYEKRRFITRDNASDTNPNEPKKPKVGDMGFFWNKEDGYVFSDLIYIDHDGSSIPYYCSLELWFRNFSHEKQPWMK